MTGARFCSTPSRSATPAIIERDPKFKTDRLTSMLDFRSRAAAHLLLRHPVGAAPGGRGSRYQGAAFTCQVPFNAIPTCRGVTRSTAAILIDASEKVSGCRSTTSTLQAEAFSKDGQGKASWTQDGQHAINSL